MRAGFVAWMVGALLMLPGAAAQSQEPKHEHKQAPGESPADMSARCQAAMAQHEKMMGEMKAADQRLDELVSKMHAATGEAKVDAVAAVVTEFASQRKTMRDRMMTMHRNMMTHMGEHMQAGPQSAAGCPMMKMGGMKH